MDGTDLPSSDFAPIAGSSYSGAQVAVDFGSHTLTAALPFGLTIYGYGGYDGYGYPGGFTLSPIATVNTVTLSVGSGTGVVGTQACPVATATDQNGNPVDGVLVNFAVTGANPNAGFAYTDSSGQAQYCYTGTTVGDDQINAVGRVHPGLSGYMGLDAAGGDCDLGVDHAVRWREDGSVDLGPRQHRSDRRGRAERHQRRVQPRER